MSQAFDPDIPRPAATLLLLRDAPFEVLMVTRHHQIDFAGGAMVFPGGAAQPGDRDPAWRDHVGGWDDLDEAQRPLRIAAIREAWEEAGILVAEGLEGPAHCEPEPRAAVDAGKVAFLEVVKGLDARLSLDALTVFSHWITPQIGAKRYDTFFFLARAPADQVAACDGREAVDAEWIAPAEALRLAEAGERRVIFPTRMNLKLLAEASSVEDAIARARARRLVTVLPAVEEREGRRLLILPPDAGYGVVEEPLENIAAIRT